MSRAARMSVTAGFAMACGAADPLVEDSPDPEWTDAELRDELNRVLDQLDPSSQQAGGASVAQSLALDEALFPSGDEDARRALLEDMLVEQDGRLGCPTRALVAGFWVPEAGRNGRVATGIYDGGDEPQGVADGSYQDGTEGEGDSLLFWEDEVGRRGDMEGVHGDPDPQSLAVYEGFWVERETGDAYGRAGGLWHPFRNQPGGLLVAAWANCSEGEDGTDTDEA